MASALRSFQCLVFPRWRIDPFDVILPFAPLQQSMYGNGQNRASQPEARLLRLPTLPLYSHPTRPERARCSSAATRALLWFAQHVHAPSIYASRPLSQRTPISTTNAFPSCAACGSTVLIRPPYQRGAAHQKNALPTTTTPTGSPRSREVPLCVLTRRSSALVALCHQDG